MRKLTFVWIALWSAALIGGASAHAMLDHAVPAVGKTVKAVPDAVVITFTEGVEPKFSAIEVRNAHGDRVDEGNVRLGVLRNQLSVSLKPLEPGRYTVNWSVLSVDSHKTSGNFTFTVGK